MLLSLAELSEEVPAPFYAERNNNNNNNFSLVEGSLASLAGFARSLAHSLTHSLTHLNAHIQPSVVEGESLNGCAKFLKLAGVFGVDGRKEN